MSFSSCEAHWDCIRGGASGEALFASCIDAVAGSDNVKAKTLVQNIQSSIQNGLLQNTTTTKFDDFSIVLERVSSGGAINGTSSIESGWSLHVVVEDEGQATKYSLSELQDIIRRGDRPPAVVAAAADVTSLPVWVRETAVEVLTEVTKAHSKVHGGSASDTTTSTPNTTKIFTLVCLVQVVGTLLGLVALGGGIEVVSCSPIPVLDGITDQVILQLLMGMVTTNTTATVLQQAQKHHQHHNFPPINNTAIGVALLRVLSGLSRSNKMHPRASSMVLKASGVGTSHTKSSKTTTLEGAVDVQLGGVRILVGEVLSESEGATTTTPTATNTTVARPFPASNPPPSPPPPSMSFESELWLSDAVTLLECNLDDMTGETLAFMIELLLQNGAVDAWVTPIIMKKGRPAYTLSCLCPMSSIDSGDPDCDGDVATVSKTLLEVIFRHTTTLGVRIHANLPRAKLRRSFITVSMPYDGIGSHVGGHGDGRHGATSSNSSQVSVKVGQFCNSDKIITKKAEYDDCRAISIATGIPLSTISEQAIRNISSSLPFNHHRGGDNDSYDDQMMLHTTMSGMRITIDGDESTAATISQRDMRASHDMRITIAGDESTVATISQRDMRTSDEASC